MNIKLKENERIDDLEFNNLKIIQNEKEFCLGMDAVLLSDFAKDIKQNSKIIDLGTGTGILPILLSGKTLNTKNKNVERFFIKLVINIVINRLFYYKSKKFHIINSIVEK